MSAKRTEQAIAVLTAGGFFRKALETQPYGREKFCVRLRDANGLVVKGIGASTLHALENAGTIRRRECTSGSTFPQEWELAR